MSTLEGRRVLLVEDESLVAMLAEDILIDLGCDVVVAMRLEQALTYVDTLTFDLAILDVNLGATRSYPVADALAKRGTPFLFATGYGGVGLQGGYSIAPVVQKPYQTLDLRHGLLRLLGCEERARRAPGAPQTRYA